MMRRSLCRLCALVTSNQQPSREDAVAQVPVLKDYRQLAADRRAEAERAERERMLAGLPLPYRLLEVQPGVPLHEVKLRYLLAARRSHPAVGGEPEAFLRICLAYQDVLKDYGLEVIENQIVNLGNFQADESLARDYLAARARITAYIAVSTLDDHIRQLEAARERLGGDLSERLSANNDDAMWLLEDIEAAMGTGTAVRVALLPDGSVKLLGGADAPLGIEGGGSSSKQQQLTDGTTTAADAPAGEPPAVTAEPEAPQFVAVTRGDIEVLNAKHNIDKRVDIAGEAARAAGNLMFETRPFQQVRLEGAIAIGGLMFLAMMLLLVALRYQTGRARSSELPDASEHLMADSMMPWWGNDQEYESQVKRLFVEEWRGARSKARRVQTFQEGVARESLAPVAKERLDVDIFTVTSEHLREMKERALANPGRR